MARRTGATPLQKTLAEELAEVEAEEKVTGALQAVDHHGMLHANSPRGQQPREPTGTGVANTPVKTPKIGKTPSPIKVDQNGEAWVIEQDQEEAQEEQEDKGEEVISPRGTRSAADPRARAGSVDTKGPADKPGTKQSMESIVKDWLYPEGGKEDTPQMRSPADISEEDSSGEENWATQAQVDRLQVQLGEMRKFLNAVVKKHSKDIDSLKTSARLAQRTNGSMRD